jgi:hypothetical protein
MDVPDVPETEEQQKRIRRQLNENMRKNAAAETKFQNAWRTKLEKKIGARGET